MLFSGASSYFDSYVRKNDTNRTLNDPPSLLTDRGAYVNYLEVQLERISAALLGVQAYDQRFCDMQSLIVSLEQRCMSTTKLVALAQQCTEELKVSVDHKFNDVAEAMRQERMELQQNINSIANRATALEATAAQLPVIVHRIDTLDKQFSDAERHTAEMFASYDIRCKEMASEIQALQQSHQDALQSIDKLFTVTSKQNFEIEEVSRLTKNHIHATEQSLREAIEETSENFSRQLHSLSSRVSAESERLQVDIVTRESGCMSALRLQNESLREEIRRSVSSMRDQDEKLEEKILSDLNNETQRVQSILDERIDKLHSHLERQHAEFQEQLANNNSCLEQLDKSIDHLTAEQEDLYRVTFNMNQAIEKSAQRSTGPPSLQSFGSPQSRPEMEQEFDARQSTSHHPQHVPQQKQYFEQGSLASHRMADPYQYQIPYPDSAQTQYQYQTQSSRQHPIDATHAQSYVLDRPRNEHNYSPAGTSLMQGFGSERHGSDQQAAVSHQYHEAREQLRHDYKDEQDERRRDDMQGEHTSQQQRGERQGTVQSRSITDALRSQQTALQEYVQMPHPRFAQTQYQIQSSRQHPEAYGSYTQTQDSDRLRNARRDHLIPTSSTPFESLQSFGSERHGSDQQVAASHQYHEAREQLRHNDEDEQDERRRDDMQGEHISQQHRGERQGTVQSRSMTREEAEDELKRVTRQHSLHQKQRGEKQNALQPRHMAVERVSQEQVVQQGHDNEQQQALHMVSEEQNKQKSRSQHLSLAETVHSAILRDDAGSMTQASDRKMGSQLMTHDDISVSHSEYSRSTSLPRRQPSISPTPRASGPSVHYIGGGYYASTTGEVMSSQEVMRRGLRVEKHPNGEPHPLDEYQRQQSEEEDAMIGDAVDAHRSISAVSDACASSISPKSQQADATARQFLKMKPSRRNDSGGTMRTPHSTTLSPITALHSGVAMREHDKTSDDGDPPSSNHGDVRNPLTATQSNRKNLNVAVPCPAVVQQESEETVPQRSCHSERAADTKSRYETSSQMSQHDAHSLSSEITWSAVKDFYAPDMSQLDRDGLQEADEDEMMTSSPVFTVAACNPPWIPPRNVSPKTRLVGRISSDDRPASASTGGGTKSRSSSSEDLVAIEERKSCEHKEKMYAERRHFIQESHLVGARSQLKEEK